VAAVVSLTAAGVAIAFAPDESRIIVQLELALVGVITIVAVVGALRRAAPLAPPSPLDRVPRPEARSPRPLPLDLVRISRRLAAAEASAADTRRNLAPLVAAIAADRLRRRAHTTIEADSVYPHLPLPVSDALALVLDPALADVDTRELPGLDAEGSEALVRALEQL
jgi:CBS domain-containing protein